VAELIQQSGVAGAVPVGDVVAQVAAGAVVDGVNDHACREEGDRIALDVGGFAAGAVALEVRQRLKVSDPAVVVDGDPVAVRMGVADPDGAVRTVGHGLRAGVSAVDDDGGAVGGVRRPR
jgi:hypothetical protein